jgi:hypothetical protein
MDINRSLETIVYFYSETRYTLCTWWDFIQKRKPLWTSVWLLCALVGLSLSFHPICLFWHTDAAVLSSMAYLSAPTHEPLFWYQIIVGMVSILQHLSCVLRPMCLPLNNCIQAPSSARPLSHVRCAVTRLIRSRPVLSTPQESRLHRVHRSDWHQRSVSPPVYSRLSGKKGSRPQGSWNHSWKATKQFVIMFIILLLIIRYLTYDVRRFASLW